MIKVLATDLDGTLFYPNPIKTILPKKNVIFLRKWIDSGHKLVVVTSRSRQFIDYLKKEIDRPFDYLVCSGSEIYANGELIREVSAPNDQVKEILDKINKDYHPMAYLMTTKDYPCIIHQNVAIGKIFLNLYRLWQFFQFKRAEPYIISNKIFNTELDTAKIFKIMIFFGLGNNKKKLTKEMNKVFRVKYSQLEFSWSSKVIEITPYGCSKGKALEYYCSANNINFDEVAVIGDSGNDISMFNTFHENSYCMKHAYTGVRKYAKHTVSKVYKLEKFILKGENK